MDRQAGGILPIPYFHVVFTLPRPVARIAPQNRGTVLDILFRTAAETLRTIGTDPARFGARTGGTALLHAFAHTGHGPCISRHADNLRT